MKVPQEGYPRVVVLLGGAASTHVAGPGEAARHAAGHEAGGHGAGHRAGPLALGGGAVGGPGRGPVAAGLPPLKQIRHYFVFKFLPVCFLI